jgi:hypothetical protein
VQKLREALIAFLNDKDSNWEALSRDLRALAAAPQLSARISPLLQSPQSVAAHDKPIDPDEARDAWRQLADHLAHANRARGIPEDVQRLLESDVAARAAAAAFGENLSSQRAEWLEFSREIARERQQQQQKHKPRDH